MRLRDASGVWAWADADVVTRHDVLGSSLCVRLGLGLGLGLNRGLASPRLCARADASLRIVIILDGLAFLSDSASEGVCKELAVPMTGWVAALPDRAQEVRFTGVCCITAISLEAAPVTRHTRPCEELRPRFPAPLAAVGARAARICQRFAGALAGPRGRVGVLLARQPIGAVA